MTLLLIAALLSIFFFSLALAIELRHGESPQARELLLIVGLSLAVAAYATHEIMLDRWTMVAAACGNEDGCTSSGD